MAKNTAPDELEDENEFSPEGFADEAGGSLLGDDDELDISEAKEFAFTPLPRGNYVAEVIDIEYKLSKSSQKPMLAWTFGTQVEGDDGKTHTRKLFMNDSMKQDQLGRVKKHIATVNPDYDLSHFRPSTIGEDLKGYECRLKLDIKPYNGKLSNEVKDVLPAENAEGSFLPIR